LEKEGVLTDPGQSRLVPDQYYDETVGECARQLSEFIASRGTGNKLIHVFVDGVPKKCSEDNDSHVDALFLGALAGAGLPAELVNLSQRFNIPSVDLHASYQYVEKAQDILRSLKPGICLVLGSGSITDIVKQALFLENSDAVFISVPTALTVTAFTSAFSVIDRHGAKRTQPSREINATFWIRSVLDSAPMRMSRAGYGDLLARFVAYGDWYLGKCLGVMDRYDELAFRLMEPFARGIKENASGFSRPSLPVPAIECISSSLAMAGIAMSVSGETTPLSGFEHVISHGLDFLRLTAGRELVFHGEQVALACLTNVRAIDRLLGKERIDPDGWLTDPEKTGLEILEQLIDEAPLAPVGPVSDGELKERISRARREFLTEYEKKSKRWAGELRAGRIDEFIRSWPEIKTNLVRVTLRAPEISDLMKSAGLPLLPGDTTPATSEEEYRWAVRFSPFVRSRMNTADLIFWMGEDIARFIYS
jgi:glycerol-1-phosphate dehydrogenase [NAD(P)+]